MLKNLLILSSFIALTACQSVPVKNVEIKKAELPKPKVIVDSDNDSVPDNIDQYPNTPLNVVVDAKGCPLELNREPDNAIQIRISYDKNQAFPTEHYLKEEIKRLGERMTEYPKSVIDIEGHASKADTDPEKISRERAIIIAQILREKYGINENRISINSYGTERPVATNKTQEGQNRNQRVYMIISHLSN